MRRQGLPTGLTKSKLRALRPTLWKTVLRLVSLSLVHKLKIAQIIHGYELVHLYRVWSPEHSLVTLACTCAINMFGGLSACSFCGQFVSMINEQQMCVTCASREATPAAVKPDVDPRQRLKGHFDRILDRVYLSNLTAARDKELLLSLGVTHIVDACNVSPAVATGPLRLEDVAYCEVDVSDTPKAALSDTSLP